MGTCQNEHKLYNILLLITFACGFNLDTEHPRIFRSPEKGFVFGHRVCHFGSNVMVTDPFHGNGTGSIYRCFYNDGQCKSVPVKVNQNSAFGLSLACGNHRAVVCGPHLQQKCEGFNYLNGICVEFSDNLKQSHTLKPAFQECHKIPPLDAVILFDDSQSISNDDFSKMINFIKAIIKTFQLPRSQVAVAKFSTESSAVFQFDNFAQDQDADNLMKEVDHSQGQTYTPSAIRFVLEKMFLKDMGMRNESQKLLVVITDGKSNDPLESFDTVIPLAEARNIIRFAIGVGKEYSHAELDQIASSSRYVLETDSFSALASILKQLKEKIFSIEGLDEGYSSTIQLELSQGGFSVALSEDESVFGAVGAYSWSGGMEKVLQLNASFINTSGLQVDMRDSYLGYSVAVAKLENSTVYFAGAPRYKHTGLVLGFSQNSRHKHWEVSHRADGSQLGSYFGAELCMLKDSGGVGLLAVGVPMYHALGVGGEVHICSLAAGPLNCSDVLRGAAGNVFGRFGSSLATLKDLNGDNLMELVVGAPHEEQGRGAVYIFLSCPGGIRTKYSQRVLGGAVGAELQYFGLSLHSAGDLSSDGLPDVVVGSRGAATVLRTHPVMCVSVNITLDPSVIPQNSFHCATSHGFNTPVSKATVCITLKEVSMGTITSPLHADVSMSLELDTGVTPPRLFFSSASSRHQWNTTLNRTWDCNTFSITTRRCISDYHDVPLSGKLTVIGKAIKNTEGLKPILSPECPPVFTHMVLLEKVCGENHVCISDPNMSLKFSRDMVVNIEGFPVELSVVVVNNGEDSTDTDLLFLHPSILSFTHVTVVESSGYVGCVSNNTGQVKMSHTTCKLSFTLRKNAKVVLNMSFEVSEPSALSNQLAVNASVSSKNENPTTLHDNTVIVYVPFKRIVNFLLQNNGSTRYIRYHQTTQLQHTYQVMNLGELSVPVSVVFVLPVDMRSGFLWDVSLSAVNGTVAKCERPVTLKNMSLYSEYCSGSRCHQITCSIDHISQPVTFSFSGNITRKKVSGMQINVLSWGVIKFDEDRYTQYLNDDALMCSIVTEVELPSQTQTVLIAFLSVFFGILALVIVFLVLYKAGVLGAPSSGEDGCNLPADGMAEQGKTSVSQNTSSAPDESGVIQAASNHTAESTDFNIKETAII
ncbi:integrin alpha-X-like isoform X2 [Electrophorus electricus]|uniref:integrin alpha-X-like isoform X2 n=1 Tax=Electrophorus electricus TaxID=8005 RepID=UPI0015CF93ED|nr:integrin alpha-X-like isoform X2 [Electrophorus electricus]